MKKLVQLLLLFVALMFSVAGCGDPSTTDTIGDGVGNSGALGNLADTEFIKTGSSVTSSQVEIDNATSTINFGSYRLGDNSSKTILLTIFNNSSESLNLSTTDIFVFSCNSSLGCIFRDVNKLTLQSNTTSTIKVFAVRSGEDKREGDIIRNLKFERGGVVVALMNIKFVSLPPE